MKLKYVLKYRSDEGKLWAWFNQLLMNDPGTCLIRATRHSMESTWKAWPKTTDALQQFLLWKITCQLVAHFSFFWTKDRWTFNVLCGVINLKNFEQRWPIPRGRGWSKKNLISGLHNLRMTEVFIIYRIYFSTYIHRSILCINIDSCTYLHKYVCTYVIIYPYTM